MVYRVYVSKKEGYNNEDKGVLADLRNNLGITSVKKVKSLTDMMWKTLKKMFLTAQLKAFSPKCRLTILSIKSNLQTELLR